MTLTLVGMGCGSAATLTEEGRQALLQADLLIGASRLLEDLPEDYQQFAREIYPGRFIVLGDRGDTVLFLQQQLNRIAAQDPDIPAVAEDGIFGRGTQAAVLALQRKLGIDPTGAVGPVLWAKIVTQGAGY